MNARQKDEHSEWVDRLEAIGLAVREQIHKVRAAGNDLATAVAYEGGDTIFAIDRHVEPIIEHHVQHWPESVKPVMLVAEGLGHDGHKLFGSEHKPVKFRLIIDPIDGTRNIMYDKRSAWFIAAIAPDRGGFTRMSEAIASVVVELPPVKQGAADTFTAIKGRGVVAKRTWLHDGRVEPFTVRPSAATSLLNGFAQVSNFFPGTKVLASQLMEHIVHTVLGKLEPGVASVFDDQYITTAGQMTELMVGHDRFVCDLRPLFYQVIGKHTGIPVRGLECHPYDLAGMLVAQESGVILTDGFGRPLDAPFDVHRGVHWCGYANETLQKSIAPVIVNWFRQHGVEPE